MPRMHCAPHLAAELRGILTAQYLILITYQLLPGGFQYWEAHSGMRGHRWIASPFYRTVVVDGRLPLAERASMAIEALGYLWNHRDQVVHIETCPTVRIRRDHLTLVS